MGAMRGDRAGAGMLRPLWEAAPLRGLSRAALRDLAGQARGTDRRSGHDGTTG